MRPLGAANHSLGLKFQLAVLVVFSVWGVEALAADPPNKANEVPPVIPREAPATPASGTESSTPATTPAQGEMQPLPENLPLLLDPARPLVIPRRRPAPAAPASEATGEEDAGDANLLEEPGVIPEAMPVENNVALYSLENPVARTSLFNAFSNAESFYDGFGGIPQPQYLAIFPRPPAERGRGFRAGPLTLRPALSSAVISSRGETGGGGRETETVFSATVGGVMGTVDTGRFLTLDYGASRSFGSDQDNENKIDQSLFLAGHLEFGRLKLAMGIDFVTLSGYSRDIGAQTQRDLLTVALTSTVQITPKVSFDWDLAMPNGRYPNSGSSTTGAIGDSSGFASTNFINYDYSPVTKLGLGFSTGFLEVQDADKQTFQQVLTRISSTPTPFFNYTGAIGMEFRDTGHRKTTHPIFVLGAIWTPRDRTIVSLAGEQRVQNSAAASDSNFVSSSVILSLSQRMGDRYSFSVTTGYELAKYEGTGVDDSSGRRERSYFGQIGLSANITERLDVSATFSYTKTESDEAPAEISQFALRAAFSF